MDGVLPGEARRVVHLVTSDAFAGIERHAVALAQEQRRQGWPATIACPPSALALRSAARSAGVPVEPSEAAGRLWLASLLTTVRASRPDVIHAHDGKSALVGRALVGVVPRAAFVRTQHFVHPATLDRKGWKRRLSLAAHRSVNHRLDGYIAVSDTVGRAGRDRHETGRAAVAVIPPAICLPADASRERAQATRQALDHPVVAFTGRLERERHLDVLLRAVPLIRDQLPDCRFVLAGSGTAAEELRHLADHLGIQDAITWPGWVEDTSEVFSHAHLYVNTWPREAFGMAMAEAMSLGLPVVAVAAGANREMVDDGTTGVLVAPDDPTVLAAAVVSLLSDRAVAERMGDAAARRCATQFDSRATTASTIAFYDKAAARRRR